MVSGDLGASWKGEKSWEAAGKSFSDRPFVVEDGFWMQVANTSDVLTNDWRIELIHYSSAPDRSIDLKPCHLRAGKQTP
jgi:hypothetical protein